ncbi:transglycosylase domain-containing protein [Bacillus sp. 2205SS5-2]|uniref:transglycosylase domain-containing protein n=1 Tax=Bacillus sp. 2205SS5-2 TaxID=3109031 RepID=UPI0030078329
MKKRCGCVVRTFTGYLTIVIIFPLFVFIVYLTGQEVVQVEDFQQKMDRVINKNEIKVPVTSLLLDQNGEVFSEVNTPYRLYAKGEEIPPYLKDVMIFSEDQNFYDHFGFDAGAILRAVVKNLVFTHIQQGGSTITQQLVRNLYLDQEKSYNRKLTELFYAYELEQALTKEEILDLYLNVIYFSNGIYGAESASQHFFQKPLTQLSKAELTFLASIPNNPAKYDPVAHFDATKERQERLLDTMMNVGKLTHEEVTALKAEKISLHIKKHENAYPDYAVYVEEELRQLISLKEGFYEKNSAAQSEEEKKMISASLDDRVEEIITSGVTIETNLDPDMQAKAVTSVKENLPYAGVEGAAIVINNSTRGIVAMSGGKDYQKYFFHRAYQAYRQPGSSVKPLLVYAPYIERFQSSLNESVNANRYCIKDYCPQNYGNSEWGMVTLQTAFIQSLNTPAVRLMEKIGVQEAFSHFDSFQFSKVIKQDQTFAAAIGGFTYGLSPLEMTRAYTSFIDGVYTEPRAITRVVNRDGLTLYEWNEESVTLWSTQTVEKVRSLLHSAAVSGTGKSAYLPKPYMGIKTGTTNQFYDYWAVGLTDEYTTGVWVGHDFPQNMQSIEKNRPSHMIWRDIMR